jgi:DNA (cytosine-5)-methyltransferase 1
VTTATLPGFSQRVTARRQAPPSYELVVDNFAGAGGASLGIEAALGRCVDVAINHSRLALEAHTANHPGTRHLCGDIWDYKPREVTGGRPVGLMWASPDCKHFSKAKGGRPVSPRVRGLAWVVVRWAREVRPRVIILENVEEFQGWGPLIQAKDGRGRPLLDAQGRRVLVPDKTRRGETFAKWIGQLRKLGYHVEWRELVAADYGVPTIRRRLFLVARCDGQPIVWPTRTHAPRHKAVELGLKPWRSAAQCIDWSIECPSIFERRRPLAEATMRRIANGLRRYVIDASEPFVVSCNHGGPEARCRSTGEPMATVTGSRDANGLVVPHLTHYYGLKGGEVRASGMADPLATQPTENRFGLVGATLVATGYGERDGQAPRVPGLSKPLGTIVGTNKGALVQAFLAKHYGGVVGQDLATPAGTITAKDHHSLVTATVVGAGGPGYSGKPRPVDAPTGTIMAQSHQAVASATLVGCGGRAGQSRPRSPGEPIATVTAKGDTCLTVAHLSHMYTAGGQGDPREPARTITAGGWHVAEVQAFLVQYYSSGSGREGRAVQEPVPTIPTRHRFGIVTVNGIDYQIADIGLRMLRPRELLRAQFGRFADEYVLLGSQAQQVAGIGNSVPPELAELLVKANVRIRRLTGEEAA